MTHAAAIESLRTGLGQQFPELRLEPKRFSMNSSDAGTAVFRITASDGKSHYAAAQAWEAALRATAGIGEVHNDAERFIQQLDVRVDQVKAQAAGVSSSDIARSLEPGALGRHHLALPRGRHGTAHRAARRCRLAHPHRATARTAHPEGRRQRQRAAGPGGHGATDAAALGDPALQPGARHHRHGRSTRT